MKKYLVFYFLSLGAGALFAQSDITNGPWFLLEPTPGEMLAVEGNLTEGKSMPSLSWAWNSAVACFPETQASKFTGNHVLYAIDLPSYSEMEISVIPKEKGTNLSVYAYMVGKLSEANTVPNLSQCVRCEVAHSSEYRRVGQDPNNPVRVVKDILALRNPYQVLVGVTGADGLAEGAYTLKVKINRRQ